MSRQVPEVKELKSNNKFTPVAAKPPIPESETEGFETAIENFDLEAIKSIVKNYDIIKWVTWKKCADKTLGRSTLSFIFCFVE